ncbi:VWA domain-containing protein [Pseudoxanthomonas wuyuanensis]
MTGWLSSLLSVHVLRPHWLWALLALPLLGALWRARRRRENVWREAVDPHLLAHLLERAPGLRSNFFWIGLAWVLAVVALAGPSWRQTPQPLWQPQAPLVIALDLSQRITAPDLPPSRLLQARAKIDALLRQRNGGQVALVAYAGEAFTVAPLTEDVANLALFLDALAPDVMPVEGQRADKAIAWSVRLLRQGQFERGDILLLTDQADGDAQKAAATAAAQGFQVSVLGLGTAAGAPYRTGEGAIARANLDAASLRALASAGGGRYAPLSSDDGDLRRIGVLEPRQAQSGTSTEQTGGAWQDQGYWLLPPLMLLVLLAFRRGGALPVLLACALLPLAPAANAAGNDWWQRPDQQAHQRLQQGAQAYREGDFAAAEQAFRGTESAEGWYNLGNALAKQGQYGQAIAAYDRALQQRPGMEDAIANRAAVDAARKRQPPGGGASKPPQSPGQGQPPDDGQSPPQSGRDEGQSESAPPSPAESQRHPSESGQPSDQAPAKPPSSPSESKPDPEPPQDARAQQAADAAQRERMQQAMAQAGEQAGERGVEAEPANAAETQQQREQRQAVEAWLRRVPDDPGGLLKMKFRLEYERRLREGQ